MQVMMYDLGLQYRRQIIWNYENGWSRSTSTLATHYEPILWFSKSETFTYVPIREPYKSVARLKYPIRKDGRQWIPHPEGRLAGDVWSFPTLAGRRFAGERLDHPTQKPLALTDRIIEHFSTPGDIVAVPFVGSGTECVSARMHGRHFVGAEVNPAYVELAGRRLTETSRLQRELLPLD
jgi:DNA modification methylase